MVCDLIRPTVCSRSDATRAERPEEALHISPVSLWFCKRKSLANLRQDEGICEEV